MSLTWEDVIARDDLVGGDLESQENGLLYRGPIASITRAGDILTIKPVWVARLNPDDGGWEKWHSYDLFVNTQYVEPTDIGGGRIFFQLPLLGAATIFPRGGSQLKPHRVAGLHLSTLAESDSINS